MSNNSAPGRLMSGYMKVLGWLNRILLICSGASMTFITVIITADVCGRAFFRSPIQGTSEMVECICSMIAFMGLGVCTMAKQHIKVELVVEHLPKKAQKVFDVFNYLVVTVVAGYLAAASWSQGMKQLSTGSVTYLTKIPYWPFYVLVALAFLLMGLNAILLLIAELTGKEVNAK